MQGGRQPCCAPKVAAWEGGLPVILSPQVPPRVVGPWGRHAGKGGAQETGRAQRRFTQHVLLTAAGRPAACSHSIHAPCVPPRRTRVRAALPIATALKGPAALTQVQVGPQVVGDAAAVHVHAQRLPSAVADHALLGIHIQGDVVLEAAVHGKPAAAGSVRGRECKRVEPASAPQQCNGESADPASDMDPQEGTSVAAWG